VVRELGREALRLGVAAPEALQRTALEKDERPDAGPVVHGVVLDVENQPVGHEDKPSLTTEITEHTEKGDFIEECPLFL
jgi:hypothetical protein